MSGKILIPMDGSQESLKAFIPAKSIAQLLNMDLLVLHVSNEELTQLELMEKLNLKCENLHCFVIQHRKGDPAKIIIAESKNCNYIVMGTHSETCGETFKIGSITSKVIEAVDKPVLLIKPNAYLNIMDGIWKPKKVLIPIDGASGSAQALLPTMELLAKTLGEIDLLHIYEQKAEPIREEGLFTVPYYVDYPQHEWPSWSKEFLKRFCPIMEKETRVKTNVSFSKGDPGDQITAFVEKNGNDFIAVAWHGILSKYHAQVLKKILFNSNCPIMLIRIKNNRNSKNEV